MLGLLTHIALKPTHLIWVHRINNGCLFSGLVYDEVHVVVCQCWEDLHKHVLQLLRRMAGVLCHGEWESGVQKREGDSERAWS